MRKTLTMMTSRSRSTSSAGTEPACALPCLFSISFSGHGLKDRVVSRPMRLQWMGGITSLRRGSSPGSLGMRWGLPYRFGDFGNCNAVWIE